MNAFVVFGAASMLRRVLPVFAVASVFGLMFEALIVVVEAPTAILSPNITTYLAATLAEAGYYTVRALNTVFRPPLENWPGWYYLRTVYSRVNAGVAFHLAGL